MVVGTFKVIGGGVRIKASNNMIPMITVVMEETPGNFNIFTAKNNDVPSK